MQKASALPSSLRVISAERRSEMNRCLKWKGLLIAGAVVMGFSGLSGCAQKSENRENHAPANASSGGAVDNKGDLWERVEKGIAAYEAAGSSAAEAAARATLADPEASGEVLLKDSPEEGDLIRGGTFYAWVPRNRYGASAEEGDYARGQFLLWLNQVELSESGELAARSSIAVPYIVSEDGNAENLSMLSGGRDGDRPYDDEIWEITTDENGEIIDAVSY